MRISQDGTCRPTDFVNAAPDSTAAGNVELASELWQESMEYCRKYLREFESPEWTL